MVALSICLWIIFAAYTESRRAPQSFQLQVFRRYNASFFKAATDVPVYLEENSAVLVIQIKATEKTEVSIPRECYISAYSHHNLLHPSLGYQLIKEYCAIRGNKVSAQPSNDRAMQFGFLIQQSFGVFNQFLFLHCTIITCQANHTNSSLASTAFRCRQSGQAGIRGRCPRKKEENITTGPFVVWPDWLKQGPETSNDVEGSERGNATREVEVRLFGNDSFQLEYKENVINIETHRKVYVEFKATDFRRVAFPSGCYLSLSKTYNKGHSKDREDLIEENCEFQFGVSYRKTHNKAVRFRFIIRQSLGAIGERLYLHCNVTVCRRNDAPEPTIFNCFTHGEYCPNKTAELITKGPFVVWPFITIEERDKLKKQSSTRPRIFFPISPTGFQSFPYQGNENQNLFADSNRAFAVAGFLPLGLLLVVMTIVCYHITLMRRKAKSLVRLEPPCEEFGTQANAEELNANTTETRL